MKKLTKSIIVACMCLSLAACGFTLRGTADLPEELQTLQVAGAEPDSDLVREVTRTLRNNGIEVVDSGTPYRLGIGRESSSERTLSVNANARAGEYELELRAPFQLTRGGDTVLGPETVSITRVYLTDPENAVAKEEEAELIREEMRRELTQQILFRLQAADI